MEQSPSDRTKPGVGVEKVDHRLEGAGASVVTVVLPDTRFGGDPAAVWLSAESGQWVKTTETPPRTYVVSVPFTSRTEMVVAYAMANSPSTDAQGRPMRGQSQVEMISGDGPLSTPTGEWRACRSGSGAPRRTSSAAGRGRSSPLAGG